MSSSNSEDPTQPTDPHVTPTTRVALPSYEITEVIGRGGWGEVVLARDKRIGRDVAIKRLKTADPRPEDIDRFLREAKIQARLDHPSIVPVYEIAFDATGGQYFAMKRLSGTTLRDAKDKLPRLLRAFVEVCNAIELAHARGIVHRDLKPSNVMLGEYGEVYVIDWGIARVIGEPDPEKWVELGTPAFMAPEQKKTAEVGPPADVYALGGILRELLAREPDHAPELDAAMEAALQQDPAARPTARQLGDRIQRYVDGDRDVALRRSLAAEQLGSAREAKGVEALRLAGRALALDPESRDAATLVTQLMLAPPTEPTPGLDARLAEVDAAYMIRSRRVAVVALLAMLGFVPLTIWCGLTSWSNAIATWAGIVGVAAFTARFGGRGGWPLAVEMIILFALSAQCSRVLGPFLLVPGIAAIVTMGLMSHPRLIRRPWLVLALGISAVLAPIVLEALGVWQSTWEVVDGAVLSKSTAIRIGGVPTIVLLVSGNIALIAITGLFSRQLSVLRHDAQRQVESQAWRLQQLVPLAQLDR